MGEYADMEIERLESEYFERGLFERRRESPPELVHMSFTEVVKETEKAYYVHVGDGEHTWLPKSQVSLSESTSEVVLPEWLYDSLTYENPNDVSCFSKVTNDGK